MTFGTPVAAVININRREVAHPDPSPPVLERTALTFSGMLAMFAFSVVDLFSTGEGKCVARARGDAGRIRLDATTRRSNPRNARGRGP